MSIPILSQEINKVLEAALSGSRHCASLPDASTFQELLHVLFGFVVSQDGTIRAIAHHNDNVTVWDHAGV